MNKVLLISPNLKTKKDGKARIQPSLALMSMANVIREKYGHHVKILDTALLNWKNRKELADGRTSEIGASKEEIATEIENYSPDVVGSSVLFSNLFDSALNIADIVKEINPKTPVVLGGNHVSNSLGDYIYARNNPDSNMPVRFRCLEDPNIDYAMHGECDFDGPELFDALINGRDVSKIPGLIMRKNGKIKSNKSHVINKAGEDLDYIINDKSPAVDVTKLPSPFPSTMVVVSLSIVTFRAWPK